MVRYFCQLAYLGTNYHGWQIQKNAHTVQEEIEKALSLILGYSVSISGSGRTDTGVHAYQQFFHFDSTIEINTDRLVIKLNSLLSKEIAIQSIFSVQENAHTRFDAIKRSYIYRITRNKNPFLIGLAYNYREVNLDLMNQASEKLLGERNFESFSKVKTEVNNFLCNVFEAIWYEEDSEIKFRISANRFLRGMVRAIVGTLLLVGEGKMTVQEFEEIILAKDRKKAGRAVPPEGLYLSAVEYDKGIFTT